MSSTRETERFDAWLEKVEKLPEPQRSALIREARSATVRRRSLQAAANPAELARSVDSDYVMTPAIQKIAENLEWALTTPRARLMITMPPQEGKLVADSELVPTPTGWARHGDLRVGDWVFHPSGNPIRVIAVHPKASATLRVRTTDHGSVRVHPRHEWTVYDRSRGEWRTVETQYLMTQALRSGPEGRGGRYRFQLPNRDALKLPEASLPVDPYTLGVWLGDGSTDAPRITHSPADSYDIPYPVTSTAVHATTGAVTDYYGGGLRTALRTLGVLGNKHLPDSYLRASEAQRRALLAGLIDSDGHVSASCQVSFDNTDRALVESTAELARTLGYRAHVHKPTAPRRSSSGVTGTKPMWRTTFTVHDGVDVARLERKRLTGAATLRRVAISTIEEIEPEQGNCITVDSADGLYMVGELFTPTHNTELTAVWTVLRALQRNPDTRIILASYSQDLAEVAASRARNIIAQHGTGAKDQLTGLEEEDMLGLELAYDKAAASHWRIRGHKGGVVAVGLAGTITGRAADLIIIDDPIKGMSAADSKAERDRIISNYRGDLTTRLSATAPVILIQTRWHEEDLAGFILKQEESRPSERRRWRRVNIPALSVDGIDDALGREPGVWMKSARGRSPDVWEEIREDVGERVFFALYEGDPTPPSGGLFKTEWFDRYRMTATGPTTRRLVSVDPAETGKRDEAGIIGVAANRQGRVMWTHDWSGLMTSDQWMRKAILLALLIEAEEITFEAYTTEQTYERGFRDTWTDIRLQARLLRRHRNDLDAAAAELASDDRAPRDPMAALSELLGLKVPDSVRPPFRVFGYRGNGDKIARASGSRRALETGRLAVVGSLPQFESQASQWQVGQDSPDRMDAAVNGYERMRDLMGRKSSVSAPVGLLADAGELLATDID